MKVVKKFVCLSILGLVVAYGLVFSGDVFADISNTSRISVTLPEILTLRLLDDSATQTIEDLPLEVAPTANGVFTKNSLIAEVSTSNPTGYKLYLGSLGKDHTGNYTTALINTDADVPSEKGTVATLPENSAVSEADFSVINSSYRNKWGYSTNSLENDPTSVIFSDIPEYGIKKQLDNKTSASDHGTTTVTIGANITSGINSGIYRNILEFTAIANPPELDFALSFNANTSDAVSSLPEVMNSSSSAAQVNFTIPSTVPERDGYEFSEWNTAADGSGDSYAPGSNFTIAADNTPDDGTKKILYAVWKEKTYTYYIQYTCATGATNCPSSQTITGGKSIKYTIPSKKPALSGYTFVEYAVYYTVGTAYDYASYQPGQTITINYGTFLQDEGTANERNYLRLYAMNYSTFTLGGKSWAGPMKAYTQYPSAASYCPSGYRLPTQAEIRTLIGTSGTEYASETNANVISLVERLKSKGGNAPYYQFWTSTAISNGRYAYFSVISEKYTNTYNTGDSPTQYKGVLCTK